MMSAYIYFLILHSVFCVETAVNIDFVTDNHLIRGFKNKTVEF